jgi:uncharacterized membrane protein
MWLRFSAFLMLTYPLLAPFFLWLEEPMFLVFMLAAILLLVALDRLQKKDIKRFVVSLVGLLLIVSLLLVDFAALLVYFPPVLIPLGLFILFHQSLGEQVKPLITRYAEVIDGKLSEEIVSYTRSLTKVWRALFLFLAIESLALALFAPVEVWAWFTHVFNYLFIFIIFASEFYYRRRRFGVTSSSFWTFLKKIFILRPKDLLERKL